ncbi:hypothetical protein [Klebsiella variicola]|uniref:hypothetical protein n=1 Tax=Klebsiella variicola TaxID=244366 RepID=UPI0013B3B5EC|nr:hypothetical protein [Klebsiella variicola]
MFKLIITLINHESGEQRELVHSGRYKTSDSAFKDAQKMAYVHKNNAGIVTYECKVKVVRVSHV